MVVLTFRSRNGERNSKTHSPRCDWLAVYPVLKVAAMLRRSLQPWVALGLVALAAGYSAAASAQEPAPVVVELYTSKGCNSCPPADALLGELARQPGVIALGFHVDYWNYLGWHDPFSSKKFTHRQKEYAMSFRQTGVYTPQIVIQGIRGEVGSDRKTV